MGGFARRTAALGLCLTIGLTACGKSKQPASSSATVPPAPPTTIAPAPADPYAIPATIDGAYLNRVFVALEHIDGDATRLIVANKKLVPDAATLLGAIYLKDEFTAQTNLWIDLVQSGLDGFRTPPGDRRTEVKQVLDSGARCVYVAVQRDYSAVALQPSAPRTTYVALRPRDPKQDPKNLNGTPWMIAREGYNPDGSVPASPC